MTKNLVEVFSPTGEKERHTRLNAWDLVNGAGYTWKPNVPTTPAAFPAYRTVEKKGAEPAQAVLDNAGHRTDRSVSDVIADAEDDAADDVAEDVVEDTAPAPAESVTLPRGRGRKAAG